MTRLRFALALFLGAATLLALAAPDAVLSQDKKKAAQPKKKAPEPPATDPLAMKVAKGFKVELLYSVPRDDQGSWVSMCHDPKGRLIVCDQYGGLYRITPAAIGGNAAATKVEKIPAAIGNAQGLLWAFDALYVVVNDNAKSGLYKVTASKGDDTLDTVALLRAFTGHNKGGLGEHGPHAVMLHPDGKRLTVVCGNQTEITKYDTTRVPPVWGEDHLLPRLPDGNNFMKGVMGPGGAIYNVTPDGKTWELYSVGFRNQYDAAYNKAGDLFTYDADMEWDFNTPWYRPTRVCLVTSGSEFGWRNGAGKYPPYYVDNLPGILNIGPGSPTGVCFGYGAKFPQKYQDAFFICDWSYGKLYAVHMKPSGSGYTAEAEEFIAGTPLPLTDIVINPVDGAMYFAIGGRRTKSGLYRVTYTGGEAKKDAPEQRLDAGPSDVARKTRLDLEAMHKTVGEPAVTAAFKELDNADRFLRFAARVALEHQDAKLWQDKALGEKDAAKAIPALLALARVSAPCPDHTPDRKVQGDAALRGKILAALSKIDFAKLSDEQKLDMIRVYHVALNRFGMPPAAEKNAVIAKFDDVFPVGSRYIDGELSQLMIYLEAPSAAAKTMKLLAGAPTQEEQLEYVRALRVLKTGWTPDLRKDYFNWFLKASGYRGGNSFVGFLNLIRADAAATLTPDDKETYKAILALDLRKATPPDETPRPFVKAWRLDDLAPALEKGLVNRDFDRGRKLFAAGKCFACHRYDNEGGSNGPDLTGVAGRFNPRDLLESIVDPSKEVSDQYGAVEIRTHSGKLVVGRIVNLNNNEIQVNTNMLDPGKNDKVDRNDVESMKPSKTSMMPAGLMDTFKEDEVLDLMAYMLSRGDRKDKMFKK